MPPETRFMGRLSTRCRTSPAGTKPPTPAQAPALVRYYCLDFSVRCRGSSGTGMQRSVRVAQCNAWHRELCRSEPARAPRPARGTARALGHALEPVGADDDVGLPSATRTAFCPSGRATAAAALLVAMSASGMRRRQAQMAPERMAAGRERVHAAPGRVAAGRVGVAARPGPDQYAAVVALHGHGGGDVAAADNVAQELLVEALAR